MQVVLDKVKKPEKHTDYVPVDLTKETMAEHKRIILRKMAEQNLDVLLVYADREHGSNYAYLTGFEPRFEESILVLHKDGTCYLMLGNENLKMQQYSFIEAKAVHVPHFSLPNQPMETSKTLEQLFEEAGICDGMHIGCVGWKLFTSRLDANENMIDLPAFMVNAVRRVNPTGTIKHAAGLFLDPENGARVFMNANEIAHYEYGAGLASACILDVLDEIEVGKTELELAAKLAPDGQPTNVTTICATGERFVNAVVFPRNKKVQLGDKFSLTLGLRGGLTSRAGYAVHSENDLDDSVRDYVDKVVKPYYRAAVTWYETIGIGVPCQDVYDTINRVLPKDIYHWTLNPGHYTGQDEWVGSPMFPGTKAVLQSGMMLQMDIIPSMAGYAGTSAEDGIAIADETLREEIRTQYPRTWKRIQERRNYMNEVLGINLKEEILPMSDACGYLRPYLLNKDAAMKKWQE